MIIKQLIDEDFVNYKKPSMFIAFPKCTWKCEKECGLRVCQNSALASEIDIDIDIDFIIRRYIDNTITKSIVIGGLEPFDTYPQLFLFVALLRKKTDDDVVIYTGYYKKEIMNFVNALSQFKNIIIKFGRYIPGRSKHYDHLLGVWLASDNQYAEKIS